MGKRVTIAEVENAEDICVTCGCKLSDHKVVGLSLICINKHTAFMLCDSYQLHYCESYKNIIKSVANTMLPDNLKYKINNGVYNGK